MDRPLTNDLHAAKRPALVERQPRAGQLSTSTNRPESSLQESSLRMHQYESLKPEGDLFVRNRGHAPLQPIGNTRLSAVADEAATESKRSSQQSTISTMSGVGRKRKTHVGPWHLGRTLGKGASSRVRYARHCRTGQPAAIKIVSKKSAALVQSQSMARMDKTEAQQIMSGQRTMPFGIEREVVIMKLIEHENVISLYDVWENRGELYLVLEYVEGGELFDYVSSIGALPEHEAVRLFRQIIGGLSYCHRFNICHRDLKPENLLIDVNRNVKLADFGMAALQPADRWLSTSCGSPHYAAPEIIYGRQYRGAIADIWSVGIILFAMLHGFLPFDGGDLSSTLRAVKKGDYYLPPSTSVEATDLIQRLLQKNPEERITMEEIWSHELLKKYEAYHTGKLPKGKQLVGPPPPLHAAECGIPITSREDIDPEILRNLQTLWHGDKLEDLIERLMCEEPNHEKLFYRALLRFREEQLENYQGDPSVQYSASDHHHATKPVKRSAKGALRNHKRRHSQYSVVSEDGPSKRDSYYKKPATAGSYDPYRSSGTPIVELDEPPKIIIRRGSAASKARNESTTYPYLEGETTDLPSPHQNKYPRSSATSSSLTSTRTRRDRGIRPSASYKRSVAFQHKRKLSSDNATSGSSATRPKHLALPNSDPDGRPIDTHRSRNPATEPHISKTRVTSGIWREDARKVSTELSKICEEAFNRSSVVSSDISHTRVTSSQGTDSPATAPSIHRDAGQAIDRPLPMTPEQKNVATALRKLADTRRNIMESWGDSDPAALLAILHNLDKRIELERAKMQQADQRAASDPINMATASAFHASLLSNVKLPTDANTMDDLRVRQQDRAASDPPKKSKHAPKDTTVRLVSPDPSSPGISFDLRQSRKKKQILMPLNSLRSGSSDSSTTNYERVGYDPHFPGKYELGTIVEDQKSPKKKSTFGSTTATRKWSWLGKRASDLPDDLPPTPPKKGSPKVRIQFDEPAVVAKSASEVSSNGSRSRFGQPNAEDMQAQVETKKKWFQKMFAPGGKLELPVLSNNHAILQGGDDDTESNGSDEQQVTPRKNIRKNYAPATSVDAAAAISATKPIEVSQNWFAKFLHIKPASRVLILQVSRLRAKKEIVKRLKEWRKYGIRDVIVEKRAGGDVIRGRVDSQNHLNLKPVHFYCQLYTVLEHGRKANLSLAKFTQEKGAASSFLKVVDTLEEILKTEHLLVTDRMRKKGIESSIKEADI